MDRRSPFGRLLDAMREACRKADIVWTPAMQLDLPKKWEKHGDLIVLPQNCFALPVWRNLGSSLWRLVSESLGVSRVARKRRIADDEYRTPHIDLLRGTDGWVQHIDNKIKYEYDVTRCMFSIGNVSEKLRVASFDCRQEVVVDLFAGIGYFTLPYLVHAGAHHVYAIDWNPDAVEALHRNVKVNGVQDRCTVIEGDCRRVVPCGVADRVNAGLLPTARQYLVTACRALKPTGGRIHVHENVDTKFQPNSVLVKSSKIEEQKTNERETNNAEPEQQATVTDERETSVSGSDSTAKTGKLERTDSGIETAEDAISQTASEESPEDIEQRKARRKDSRLQKLLDELAARRLPPAQLDEEYAAEKWPKLDVAYRRMAVQCADMLTQFMNNLHDIRGRSFTSTIERVGKVKSYAPHVDHVVLDVFLQPVPDANIDFDKTVQVEF